MRVARRNIWLNFVNVFPSVSKLTIFMSWSKIDRNDELHTIGCKVSHHFQSVIHLFPELEVVGYFCILLYVIVTHKNNKRLTTRNSHLISKRLLLQKRKMKNIRCAKNNHVICIKSHSLLDIGNDSYGKKTKYK